ncbi:CCDCprotein [Hibiscus syriacus]|uniref:CCDCprotein n=1 Tax=Hibiscus syriacus TaxID=106335 RepID=A0A6A3D180_HIBSY|nr:CCDCprotein [Hibiscus syriacus]
MWRRLCCCEALKQGVSAAAGRKLPPSPRNRVLLEGVTLRTNLVFQGTKAWSSSPPSDVDVTSDLKKTRAGTDSVTLAEAKKLVNVESLKTMLESEGKEVIGYSELIKACESRRYQESRRGHQFCTRSRLGWRHASFPRQGLSSSGQGTHPSSNPSLYRVNNLTHFTLTQVVDLIRRAVPLAFAPEDDPIRDELKKFQPVLPADNLGILVGCNGTDFVTTATGIIIGYAYFLLTARDPSYQDLLKRLFLRRQRKIFQKHGFDVARFKELQNKCRTPSDASTSIRNRVGLDVELDDALHKD